MQAPDKKIANFEAALVHYEAGRLLEAEAICRQLPQDPDVLHLRGVIAYQLKRNEEAAELIEKAIRLKPSLTDYTFSIDPVYRVLNRLDKVISAYRQLLALTPENAAAHNNLGNALKDSGNIEEAVQCYTKALLLEPALFEAQYNFGCMLKDQGRLDEATTCFLHAVALRPDFIETYNALGNIFSDQGKLEEAGQYYRQAISLDPEFTNAYCNLGNLLRLEGKLDEAVASYQKAISLKPDFADAYNNLGVAFYAQGKKDEAIACYRTALTYNPHYENAHNNLGSILTEQGKLEDAIACYQQAIMLNPNDPVGHCNLGSALREQHKLDEAISSYLKALALKVDYPEAYNNLGMTFALKDNYAEAIACYETALALKPHFVEAHNNLGNALKGVRRLDEALEHYKTAIALKPDFAEPHNNLGRVYHEMGCPDDAIRCYRTALRHKPAYSDAYDNLLLEMQYSANYTVQDIFDTHADYGKQFETPLKASWPTHANSREPSKRLKIGYVSPDFHKHAVAYFIEPVLLHHDQSQFEIFCYYSGTQYDAVTYRLQVMPEHWIPCKHLTDEQLAQRIQDDGIDILIDLAGHTGGNRLLTFARKPAPVQVTYLGYPCTTGLTAIDYRISDCHAEPIGMTEQWNVEKLWRLPEIFCCYRAHDSSPAVIDHPPAFDNGHITFGCFNNFAKVTDPVLVLWAKILNEVPTARLMLEIHGIDHATVRTEVETRLIRLGLPPERLVLIPRKPENQYVLYNRIDIALDPFPCNGGTTSLDTMWMGVPFITLAGSYFTSRMGVSILTNAGLPQLITQNEDEYVQVAVDLALDRQKLHDIRTGLRERVKISPLMDAPRFTRHLEQAYRGMWQATVENLNNRT